MTLQQLRYVIMVAETGTITEAASRLFISQPSLTNAIHELEKEMNITIFIRTNKGITDSVSKTRLRNKKRLCRLADSTFLRRSHHIFKLL